MDVLPHYALSYISNRDHSCNMNSAQKLKTLFLSLLLSSNKSIIAQHAVKMAKYRATCLDIVKKIWTETLYF